MLSVHEMHSFNFRDSISDGWHGSWWGIQNTCGDQIGGGGPDSWVQDDEATFPGHVSEAGGSFKFGSEQLCCATADADGANESPFQATTDYSTAWQSPRELVLNPCACECRGETGWEVWSGNTFVGVDLELDWDAARAYCQVRRPQSLLP